MYSFAASRFKNSDKLDQMIINSHNSIHDEHSQEENTFSTYMHKFIKNLDGSGAKSQQRLQNIQFEKKKSRKKPKNLISEFKLPFQSKKIHKFEVQKNVKVKSLEQIAFLARLYLYYNNEDIDFLYTNEKIEKLLKEPQFLSDAQILIIMENIAKFKNNQIHIIKNQHKNTERLQISNLMQFPAKTTLDFITYLKKAHYYSIKKSQKTQQSLFNNFLYSEGSQYKVNLLYIQSLPLSSAFIYCIFNCFQTNKQLRDWVDSISEMDKIDSNFLEFEINIIDILNKHIIY